MQHSVNWSREKLILNGEAAHLRGDEDDDDDERVVVC
jgi:hypothetical protein